MGEKAADGDKGHIFGDPFALATTSMAIVRPAAPLEIIHDTNKA